MPGLLFHHTTVTKDYIHDQMKPYVHYVPVKADLSDLKEKYDWAEANPTAAKLIADQCTFRQSRLNQELYVSALDSSQQMIATCIFEVQNECEQSLKG